MLDSATVVFNRVEVDVIGHEETAQSRATRELREARDREHELAGELKDARTATASALAYQQRVLERDLLEPCTECNYTHSSHSPDGRCARGGGVWTPATDGG